jgi:hypothetical protein
MGRTLPDDLSASWLEHWEQITPFLAYPPEVRRVIYTTNSIEALHRQTRKIIKTRGHFPTEDAARKLIYLAITKAETRSNSGRAPRPSSRAGWSVVTTPSGCTRGPWPAPEPRRGRPPPQPGEQRTERERGEPDLRRYPLGGMNTDDLSAEFEDDQARLRSRRSRPHSRNRGSLGDRYDGARDFRSRTEAATVTVRPRNLVERLALSAGYRFDRALALVHRRGWKPRRRSGRTLGIVKSGSCGGRAPHDRSCSAAGARLAIASAT